MIISSNSDACLQGAIDLLGRRALAPSQTPAIGHVCYVPDKKNNPKYDDISVRQSSELQKFYLTVILQAKTFGWCVFNMIL